MGLFNRVRKLKPLDGYNRWASSYFTEANPIKTYSNEYIAKWLIDIKGKSVLDAGCGAGALCLLAQKWGASKVTGVDLSPAMIEEATKNCKDIDLQCVDLSKEKVSGKFDVIICALVLAHIPDAEAVLKNLIDNLTPGGMMLITDFHPIQTQKGAKRTFVDKATNKTFEVEHFFHDLEHYFSIIQSCGVSIEDLVESEWKGQPVVFGMKIRKHNTN
ncbi:biotin synthase [Cytophagales bacterium WSM2-2]|nr:biotin synthase [Cytophagales bacterium WSM2-2]